MPHGTPEVYQLQAELDSAYAAIRKVFEESGWCPLCDSRHEAAYWEGRIDPPLCPAAREEDWKDKEGSPCPEPTTPPSTPSSKCDEVTGPASTPTQSVDTPEERKRFLSDLL